MANAEKAKGHDPTALANIWFAEAEEYWNPQDNRQPCPPPPAGWVSPLRTWARRWNLYDHLGCAGGGLLANWYRNLPSYDPRTDPHPRQQFPIAGIPVVRGEGEETMQTLPIQVDLDLNGEGWGYRARKARAALERELAAAKARMESEATARGLKRMPPPRKPEHYVWIAEA
ncbi:MAG TPA: hypothetical protein VNL35_09005, partial [Chloroflexota bacterium]|nr:hypothetical protein [Chloroflexota bacterium]